MIETSITNAKEGVEINQEVLQSIDSINDQIDKISTVMSEIADASDSQNKGVEQLNTAVDQISGVTQQNAASTEETASAANELNSQAEQMNSLVGRFQLSYQKNTFNTRSQKKDRVSAPPKNPASLQKPKQPSYIPKLSTDFLDDQSVF